MELGKEGIVGIGVLLFELLCDKEIMATVKAAMHKVTAIIESVTLFMTLVCSEVNKSLFVNIS